jgi:hypothetical protein
VSDTFYFVAFADEKSSVLTVIDLENIVSYERNHWSVVDEENFTDRDKAIAHARALATVNGLTYEPFESRYDKSLNEPKLSLTSPRITRPENVSELKARYERILSAAMQMSEEEKGDLADWKYQYVHTGECATVDWPGWEFVIERLPID